MATSSHGGAKDIGVRQALRELQWRGGVSLAAVDGDKVKRLDFRTGRLETVAELPRLATPCKGHPQYCQLHPSRKIVTGRNDECFFIYHFDEKKLTTFPDVRGVNPGLSHAADRIAFIGVCDESESGYALYILDVAAKTTTVATTDVGRSSSAPQWSSDDRTILYASVKELRKGGSIAESFLVSCFDVATGATRDIAEDAGYPAWGAVKDEVIYRGIGQTWRTTLDDPRERVPLPGLERFNAPLLSEMPAARSPCGTFLVYKRGWAWDINIKGHGIAELMVKHKDVAKPIRVLGWRDRHRMPNFVWVAWK